MMGRKTDDQGRDTRRNIREATGAEAGAGADADAGGDTGTDARGTAVGASADGRGTAGADLAGLREIFGSRMADDEKTRHRFRRDQVGDDRYGRSPAAVVYPRTTDEVSALMKWANRTGTPVTPRGAGSGLSGGAIPAVGGVVCSFAQMDRIIEIDTDNLMVVVEPGVVTNALDTALKPYGLFFAGYPMSEDICFIGGNVAENAGGGRAVKYGTTAQYVLGAEVVSPTGEVLSLGGKRLKDVTGYNLLQLLVGSEGTLGLFTQITLRVIPRPAHRGVVEALFHDVAAATEAIATVKRSVPGGPSAIEFIDGQTARMTNRSLPAAKRRDLPADTQAYLLVEVDGDETVAVERAVEAARAAVRHHGGSVEQAGLDEAVMDAAWALRKQVPWWVKRRSGAYHSLEDVVVPPAAVPALVTHVEALRRRYDVPIALFGHAGDGNFHVTPMKRDDQPVDEWYGAVEALLGELYREVVRLGGTISGEHGIGRKRVKDLSIALSEPARESMRAMKRALDPRGVLNPGVIFPEE